jgi:ubiquinone/menaquinone biosynthesis C-methylase UbiE
MAAKRMAAGEARLRRFMRWAFGLLYHQMAWSYDLVSWSVSMGQWRSWQRAALPYLRGRRVLEVAHGTGNMLLDLLGGGRAPVGLDLSPAMSRIAGRKLRQAQPGAELRAPLVRGRVEALPFASGCFESLLSTFPTEFVGQPLAVGEFYRVLAPGGAFVCVPAAQITGTAPADRWASWLFRVTGQSSEAWFQPLAERYASAGFRARLEQVRLPRSIVMVLVAEKAA